MSESVFENDNVYVLLKKKKNFFLRYVQHVKVCSSGDQSVCMCCPLRAFFTFVSRIQDTWSRVASEAEDKLNVRVNILSNVLRFFRYFDWF